MDLLVSEEQCAILDSFTAFLDREFSLSRFHLQAAGGDVSDRERWRAMAALSWFGLGLPEKCFGVGGDLTDEMLLFRELGRHLVTPSTLAVVLAARIAAAGNDSALVEALVGGATQAALGVPAGTACIDRSVTGDFLVMDRCDNDVILVWTPDKAVLLERRSAERCQPVTCIDDSIVLERVVFNNATPMHSAAPDVDAIHLRATVLLSAMLTGASEATRDMAVAYAGVREQFGRPIGTFQAIKHRCADMAVRTEAALAQTRYAAVLARDQGLMSLPHVSAARILAYTAGLENAAANIQVHGAMGYTAECHAHRFLKRARLLGSVGGNVRQHQQLLLEAASEKPDEMK